MSEGRNSPSTDETSGAPAGDRTGSSESQPDSSGVFGRLVPSVLRRRYRLRFAVTLLLVVALICLIGVLTVTEVQQTAREDAATDLSTTARLQSTAVGQWVEGMRTQSSVIVDPDRIDATGGTDVNGYLAAAMDRGSASILGIHYVDLQADRILASTTRSYRNASLSSLDQPWAVGSLLDRSDDSVSVVDRPFAVEDRRALAFIASVSETERVVLTATPSGSIAADHGLDTVSTAVLNEEGESLFGANEGGETRDVGAVAVGEVVRDDGRITTASAVPGTDWVAVATAEQSALTTTPSVVVRNGFVLLVAVLASLSVVVLVFSRRTIAPLVELSGRARAIEEGDLDVDLSTDREDEIGRLYVAFASMRDALRQQVRESRQARQSAERSRKEMERQNRRLDQFASTLSHDLRNPLAVARGHVELLDTKLDDEQDVLGQHLTKIDDSHDRIDSIINDVLTLTRKGESVEETERFALRAVTEEAWSNIDSKEAALTVTASLTIEGDRSRLLRALENLFRNALDHGSDDVSVTVGLTEDGFYVQDDGPGIPDDAVDDIFEYGHTTSDEGTGIGLSIVKTIAEAHGWSLWIDGTYENGARFVFGDVFATEERIFEQSAFTWDHASTDD